MNGLKPTQTVNRFNHSSTSTDYLTVPDTRVHREPLATHAHIPMIKNNSASATIATDSDDGSVSATQGLKTLKTQFSIKSHRHCVPKSTIRARAHQRNWQPQRNRNFRELLSCYRMEQRKLWKLRCRFLNLRCSIQ
jgi:hypothetical protein